MNHVESPLNCNTRGSSSKHDPRPFVRHLIRGGPKRVLILLILLKVAHLDGVTLGVTSLLVCLFLPVTTNVTKETVVGDCAEKLDRGEHVGAVKHEREGEVDKGVPKVAVARYQSSITSKTSSGKHTLGVCRDSTRPLGEVRLPVVIRYVCQAGSQPKSRV